MAQTESADTVAITEDGTITIPEAVLREAGMRAGDNLLIRACGPGCVEIETVDSFIKRYAGTFPYPDGYLESLRSEWER